jgi:hypothetical protein
MILESLHLVLALVLGFSFAGLLCSGYQLATESPPSFHLLERGPRTSTFAAVPFLVFAAPFIIWRASINGLLVEGRSVFFVALTTVFSGFWSLMSGTVALVAVEACLRI